MKERLILCALRRGGSFFVLFLKKQHSMTGEGMQWGIAFDMSFADGAGDIGGS